MTPLAAVGSTPGHGLASLRNEYAGNRVYTVGMAQQQRADALGIPLLWQK
jgi:hypothetical protein